MKKLRLHEEVKEAVDILTSQLLQGKEESASARVTGEAFAQLLREWQSNACPVCAMTKWKLHPFCRGCSIRLQRVNLMCRLAETAGKEIPVGTHDAVRWAWMYDICRDYLIVSIKLAQDRRAAKDDEQ